MKRDWLATQEESARIYKDLGNTIYAGRAIGKALEAERVHALDVDPIRRRDAVLEFALSGCLSGKALAEYTKDLERQFEPEEAFETLRDLLVRRTMGGMPPVPTAAKDLTRLAKAAGRDAESEIDSLLTSIITSPAMSRAPRQFWKSVSKRVAGLVAGDDAFGVWLLVHTNCQTSYYEDSPVWGWIDLLEQWNVLPLLTKPTKVLPKDVEIPGGRAGWISRLAGLESSPSKRIFDLIELTADVIRAEGQPIRLNESRTYGSVFDVDVFEQCLELGLEVADLPIHQQLNFSGWLMKDVDHVRRNSQLTHVVADERFHRKIFDQIPDLVLFKGESRNSQSWGRKTPATRSFESASAEHDSIHEVWWQFLDVQLKQLEKGGLRDFELAVSILRKCIGESTGQQFQEILERLQKVDLSSVLQRTLAAGVIDEYGWKTFDEADDQERFPQTHRTRSRTMPMFPLVVALRQGIVSTVGPNGSQTLGEFTLQKGDTLSYVVPIMDDALLAYRDDSAEYDLRLRWLSEPDVVKKSSIDYYRFDVTAMMQYQDGVFYGSRLLRSGDTKIPEPALWFSDGERFWVLESSYNVWNEFNPHDDPDKPEALKEIDPVTGHKVRLSVPAWFEENLAAGGKVMWGQSRLLPAPDGTDRSPLGTQDGMIGWRIVYRRDGSIESRGIDGRSFVASSQGPSEEVHPYAVGMVDQPAGEGHWVITNHDEWIDSETGMTIAGTSERVDRYCSGQPMPLPIEFWHFFTVRSPETSKKLRKITLSQAKSFFEAGGREHEARKIKEDPKNPDPDRTAGHTAVAKAFPNAPPRLVQGISRISRIAAVEQISLDKLMGKVIGEAAKKSAAHPSTGETKSVTDTSREEIENGLSELLCAYEGSMQTARYGPNVKVLHLGEVVRFFTDGKVQKLSPGEGNFFALIEDLPTTAWKTFWRRAHTGADDGVPVDQRLAGTWLKGLEFLTESGVLSLKGKMTVYVSDEYDEDAQKILKQKKKGATGKRPLAFVEGNVRYVAYVIEHYGSVSYQILAYCESGECKPPKDFTIKETIPVRQRWTVSELKLFLKAVPKVNTLPLISSQQLDWAAKELGMSPIQVALAWMGDYRSTHYGQEKLTKELRAHYGWKVADIKTAVTALNASPVLPSISSEGLRADPGGLILNNLDAGFKRTIQFWSEGQEAMIPIPVEVLAKLQDLLPGHGGLTMETLGELLSNPTQCEVLQPCNVTFRFNKQATYHNTIEEVSEPKRSDEGDFVYCYLVPAICLLNYELRAGASARRRLLELIGEIRQFLDHETTTLSFGKNRTEKGWDDSKIDKDKTLKAFSDVVGECVEGPDGVYRIDNGLIVGAILPAAVSLRFRTSKLKTQADIETLMAAGALTFDYESDGSRALELAAFTWTAREDDMDAMIQTNRSEPKCKDTWDQDPRLSVPDLVATVGKTLKVGEAEATLYLQVLALHDPTNVRVKSWNQWSTKELKGAADSLVAAGHLVEAKRSRAGRGHFLPGGWESLKLPNLPIESWKLPMFGFENSDALRGGNARLIVCPRPLVNQFEMAWKRVQSGDAPSTKKRKFDGEEKDNVEVHARTENATATG